MADVDPVGLDLSACEREPIHIPGAIQEHGVLLALDEQLAVRMHAGAAGLIAAQDAITGRQLSDLFDCSGLQLDVADLGGMAQHVGQVTHQGQSYDAFAHRAGGYLIVELEAASSERPTGIAVLAQLLPHAAAIAQADDLQHATQAAAAAVRQITGYDRVMLYRFLDDGTGQVIAESKTDAIESFLNHRYPATDIPRQARALYLRNPIRVIPDVAYRAEPVVDEFESLDLSGAVLRSVSPVHVQYLKNMGVGASASLSIIHDGELWGLIACHALSARFIGHEQRQMCQHIAVTLQLAIGRLAEETSYREALRLTRRREELLPSIAAAGSLHDGLALNADELMRMVPCDGLALVLANEIVTRGVTPAETEISALGDWLLRTAAPPVFATHELGNSYPRAAGWSGTASGVLSIVLGRNPGAAVLWFRAEQVETVEWAGNPHHPVGAPTASGKLTPRHSFELWKETVRGQSRPWRRNEVEAAQQLLARLEDVVRHESLTTLTQHLGTSMVAKDEALAEKDLLVREVHHRVQNNLQLVTSMLKLQEREVEDEGARRQLQLARDRIQSVSVLHRRLWRSDDLQVVNLESYFAELIDELVGAWGETWRGKVKLNVESIQLPGHGALLLGIIVTELMTNAFKHAYPGASGQVTLAVRERGASHLAIAVGDKGVGGGGQARAGSFGSNLIQRLVKQIGGELEVSSNDPGTCVTLVMPRG